MFLAFVFFNDTATTEIYTLSLHDALPISRRRRRRRRANGQFVRATAPRRRRRRRAVSGGGPRRRLRSRARVTSNPGTGSLMSRAKKSLTPALDRKSVV